MTSITVDVALETDVGLLRERNEDLVLVQDLATGEVKMDGAHQLELTDRGVLMAVLDGMGGTLAGDRASQLAAEVLAREVRLRGATSSEDLADALVAGLLAANRAVRKESKQKAECRGMGTTLTAAALLDGALLVAHVGDSRAYILRDGERLIQVTEDQSLESALGMTAGPGEASGAVPGRHSNVILQALGISDFLVPFVVQIELQPGDMLLLCSDGVSAQVPGEEIRRALVEVVEGDLSGAPDELNARARDGGGQDNASALVARFGGPGLDNAGAGAAGSELEATPVRPRSLVDHLRRRKIRQTLNSVAILLVLTIILVGLMLLLIGPSGG